MLNYSWKLECRRWIKYSSAVRSSQIRLLTKLLSRILFFFRWTTRIYKLKVNFFLIRHVSPDVCCSGNCSCNRSDAPFQWRKLFGRCFFEIIIAESINDRIEGCVDTHDITRCVQQGAQPIRDLFLFLLNVVNQFSPKRNKVCIVKLTLLMVLPRTILFRTIMEIVKGR